MPLRRDIDDMDDDLLDQAAARDRRRERDEAAERRAEQQAVLDDQDAKAKARAAEFVRSANDSALLGEYRHAGVEPLKVNPGGLPTCSLSLLLREGWTIHQMENGEKKLVAPPTAEPRRPDQRDNS